MTPTSILEELVSRMTQLFKKTLNQTQTQIQTPIQTLILAKTQIPTQTENHTPTHISTQILTQIQTQIFTHTIPFESSTTHIMTSRTKIQTYGINCTYCGDSRYTRETYFKLNGNPDWWDELKD